VVECRHAVDGQRDRLSELLAVIARDASFERDVTLASTNMHPAQLRVPATLESRGHESSHFMLLLSGNHLLAFLPFLRIRGRVNRCWTVRASGQKGSAGLSGLD